MSTAETLDLSTLQAAPLVVVDTVAILAARKALFMALWEAARAQDPTLPTIDTLMLEHEPAVIINKECTLAEANILQAMNDSAKKLRLAESFGDHLDHLAVTYHRTSRKELRPATDSLPALMEGDEELRDRAQLAPEALADLGLTAGGYVYKVRTAFAERIKHVYPIHRGDGRVELRLLGRDGDGSVSGATLVDVAAAFRIEEGSQSTDVLTVLSAEIVPVIWDVTLVMRRGPDRATVESQAVAGLQALAASLHRIDATHYREAISTAAHVGPVITVRVNSPSEDVIGRPEAAPYVTAITVATEIL